MPYFYFFLLEKANVFIPIEPPLVMQNMKSKFQVKKREKEGTFNLKLVSLPAPPLSPPTLTPKIITVIYLL